MTTYPLSLPWIGEIRFNTEKDIYQKWNGARWEYITNGRETIEIPTDEELEKFPALKTAWEEFLTIKKLTGV